MAKVKKKAAKKIARTKKAPPFLCQDCGFVAKHAMGLGRHRSARHGAVSVRAKRAKAEPRRATPGWLTRQQAAEQAGVHYNTIRLWERGGLIKMRKQEGTRGALLDAADLARVLAERGAPSASVGADAASLKALEARFDQLLDGLERLVSSARTSSAPRRRGRPLGSKNKTTTASAPTSVTKTKGKSTKPVKKAVKKAGKKKAARAKAKPARAARARRKPAAKRRR